jgi:hypothetical protein
VGDDGRENEIANFLCRRLGETGNVICTHYYAAVVTHANRVSWVNLSIPFGALYVVHILISALTKSGMMCFV